MIQLSNLPLIEHESLTLPAHEFSDAAARSLWPEFAAQVGVEWPTPKTDNQWILTNQGWVGHIPAAEDLLLNLLPKVPLKNLFGMYEYAYNLNSFHFLDGITHADTLRDFYQQLANVLSKRVLDRARKGYYRTYIGQQDQLPFLRGRVNMAESMPRPAQVRLHCQYEEHTADIEENQLLAWTLRTILRTGLCQEPILSTVARAYRSLQSFATLQPFSAQDCVGRLYNRLNLDYQPLHALSSFFLDQAGPTHTIGDRQMVPFVVNMANLFERFVAEWLTHHLPYPWSLSPQDRVYVGSSDSLYWNIDIVIEDQSSGQTRWILDTKYKNRGTPSADDVGQVVAYAQAKGCTEAVLVYPAQLKRPLDEMVGNIRVRSLTYDLMHDLEAAGDSFIASLGANTHRIERQEAVS